jgi:hypothetical protein
MQCTRVGYSVPRLSKEYQLEAKYTHRNCISNYKVLCCKLVIYIINYVITKHCHSSLTMWFVFDPVHSYTILSYNLTMLVIFKGINICCFYLSRQSGALCKAKQILVIASVSAGQRARVNGCAIYGCRVDNFKNYRGMHVGKSLSINWNPTLLEWQQCPGIGQYDSHLQSILQGRGTIVHTQQSRQGKSSWSEK